MVRTSGQGQAEIIWSDKTGTETYWSPEGVKQWEWQHRPDGSSDWTTYWPDGSKRSESTWRNHALVPGTEKYHEPAPRS